MGNKTIFDMGKNLHPDRLDIPMFEPPKLSPEVIVALDYAKEGMDYTGVYVQHIKWAPNPGPWFHNRPFDSGYGPVIDLKPEDYSVSTAPAELPEHKHKD
jgi:hypothetical protein